MTLNRPIQLAAALFLSLSMTPLWANPPSHAPAHGWRKKHDPYYMGYTGKQWDNDYGITLGRCNRDAVGAVLGGVVGGAIGSQVGEGTGKKIATIAGAAIGAILGAKIGRDLDQKDAGCIGHALELARDNQKVTWTGEGGRQFELQPLSASSHNGLPCREFELKVGDKRTRQSACQREPGTWQLR
jgi:surface antigen